MTLFPACWRSIVTVVFGISGLLTCPAKPHPQVYGSVKFTETVTCEEVVSTEEDELVSEESLGIEEIILVHPIDDAFPHHLSVLVT